MITVSQLEMVISKSKANIFDEFLNNTLIKYEINTSARERHFLAQVLHESGNFIYTEELASGLAYEGRVDLGNTEVGDGVRFKGRGLIQITGRFNYAKLSKDLGIDLIKNPELLETPKWATMSAGWFWNHNGLNKYANLPDEMLITFAGHKNIRPIEAITRIINGGVSHLSARISNYQMLKTIIT